VVEILARLRDVRPELADKVFAELARFGACLVGNQVMNRAHAGVFRAVAQTMRGYLGLEVPVLGYLRSSTAIHESVNRRRPLALEPDSEDAAAFRELARALLAILPAAEDDFEITEDETPAESSAAPPAPVAAKPEAATASSATVVPPLPVAAKPASRAERGKPPRVPKEASRSNEQPRLPGLTPRPARPL
jgi:hypothetical protein